jgi:hypothetical protein
MRRRLTSKKIIDILTGKDMRQNLTSKIGQNLHVGAQGVANGITRVLDLLWLDGDTEAKVFIH